ncbi:hypothetical protein RZS08_55775, partial [Arthrospira platensis SPKY1]|nr:hypothetical protein [Arthrospira platensis SPKY1]
AQKSAEIANQTINTQDFLQIQLEQGGRTSSLYMDGPQNLEIPAGAYTLPPAPPSGWDARLEGDRWLVTASEIDLLLRALPAEGLSLRLQLDESRLETEAERPYVLT